MKNITAIILLFLANTISGIAQGISMISIPWYFALNEDMTRFGWVYMITNILSFVWVPYSGTLVDRYNRKHLFLAITTICGILVSGTALWGYYVEGLPWYLVAFVFTVTFLNYNIHYPALYAFIQEISEPKYYGKITSYIEIQGQVTSMLAGAGGALLLEGTKDGVLNLFGIKWNVNFNIEAWQIHEIFMIDALTYFASFIIISMITYKTIAGRKPEEGNIVKQMKIGFDFLKANSSIFIFGVASYAVFVFVMLEGFYLGAQYVKAHLMEDASVYSASVMYYACGAIFAGTFILSLFKKYTKPQSIIFMTIVTAVLSMVLFLSKSPAIYYVMLLILGLTNAGTRIMRTTFLFENIPNQVYGRASSIFFLSNISFRIIFTALFALSFFQEGNHVRYTFAILSIFLFLSALVLIKYYRQIVNHSMANKSISITESV